jgi:GNAT superfamily N-acetyltransferase
LATFEQPRKLTGDDPVEGFRCGRAPLDEWLARYALTNQAAGMATVIVSTAVDASIAGYYALSAGGVTRSDASVRVAKGVARHAVPVVVLTRLAVHENHQGVGLGRSLLRDALIRVAAAAELIGVRALLVHAKDDDARAFYMAQAEFEASPTDPLHLFLLRKDLKKAADL